MAKIDRDSDKVFNAWLDFLIPHETLPKELVSLAKKSSLSFATLKQLRGRSRRGMSTDTLIRLALSRGHSANSLISAILKIEKKTALHSSEVDWITYGASLQPKKRMEFLDFIEYLRKTWNI